MIQAQTALAKCTQIMFSSQLCDIERGRSRVRIPLASGSFLGSSHTSDLNIGTPEATLPGAWHYRVSAGTGWPGVSIL